MKGAAPDIICPRCATPSRAGACPGCAHPLRNALGMFDLSQRALDALEAEILSEASGHCWRDYVDVLRRRGPTRSAAQERISARYAESTERRSSLMVDMLLRAAATRGYREPPPGTGIALDLGVGVGGALGALASRFSHVVGVEPQRARAMLAQLRARELGIAERVTIVCTDGAGVPFADSTFDAVVAINVIEHLCDAIEPSLDEVRRVVMPGGWFVGDSRNRYDVVFPEPHLGLRWVGFLPRAAQARYAAWRGVARIPSVRLLSRRELSALFSAHFRDVSVGLSRASAFGRSRAWDSAIDALERSRWLGRLVTPLYPSYVVVARR